MILRITSFSLALWSVNLDKRLVNNLRIVNDLIGSRVNGQILVYGGDEVQQRSDMRAHPVFQTHQMLS